MRVWSFYTHKIKEAIFFPVIIMICKLPPFIISQRSIKNKNQACICFDMDNYKIHLISSKVTQYNIVFMHLPDY